MMAADRIIRWSTAGAVVGVAAVAAVASYEHAYDLVRAHGEAGWTARLVPLTVDGLIYASSMVMLDSARRKTPVPGLARWLLGLGIAATLAANVAHGLGHGLIGAAVAAWPAVALVGSYELLMMVIRGRSRRRAASPKPSTTRTRCGSRRPSCSLNNSWRTGFPRCARSVLSYTWASRGRSGCETTSPRELQGGWKVPLCERLAKRSSQRPRLEGNCSARVSAVMVGSDILDQVLSGTAYWGDRRVGGQHRPGRVDAIRLERIEQSGKELADLGEDGDQPFMERVHDTRYYG
jgi:uncharacterized protein DUF2637